MPIIKAAELWFPKLNPKRPNKGMDKKAPTWEVQIRTKDRAVKKMWEEMNLFVKLIDDEKTGEQYWRVNLKKRSLKENGEPAKPVEVKDAKLNDVDPDSIGNGSIANVRVFQHDYVFEGKPGIASILMGVQILKLVVYHPKPFEDGFQEEEHETEVFDPSGGESTPGDDVPF
jgi:hypothetical protein